MPYRYVLLFFEKFHKHNKNSPSAFKAFKSISLTSRFFSHSWVSFARDVRHFENPLAVCGGGGTRVRSFIPSFAEALVYTWIIGYVCWLYLFLRTTQIRSHLFDRINCGRSVSRGWLAPGLYWRYDVQLCIYEYRIICIRGSLIRNVTKAACVVRRLIAAVLYRVYTYIRIGRLSLAFSRLIDDSSKLGHVRARCFPIATPPCTCTRSYARWFARNEGN